MHYFIVFLKGIAMGACDVVPGVSGGTVAFVTGIYEKLISSLASITPTLFLDLVRRGFPYVWSRIDGNFLLALGLGVATGILTFAKAITSLLVDYPPVVWTFFFALVFSSSLLFFKKIHYWSLIRVLLLCSGVALGYMVTILVPSSGGDSLIAVFLAGFVAICAMILPGISGAFILLLMGQYIFIVNSLLAFKISVIFVFSLGCFCGLVTFSHILRWLFRRFHQGALCLLTGVMFGSLNKLWPWKEIISSTVNRHGVEVALLEQNISPFSYETALSLNPMVLPCFVVFVLGMSAVFMLDQVGGRG